jgi:capsular exopolysaccharide synthesis family protein
VAEQHDTDGANLRTLIAIIRRRWYALLLIALVPAAALAFSLAQEEKYTAKASILFRDSAGSGLASTDPEREAASNVEVFSLATIERGAERRLGGPRATAESVEVVQEGQSNLLSVEATDPSPRVAARTANAYAAEYVAFRRAAERRGIQSEVRFLRDELARGNGDPALLSEDLRRLQSQLARGGSDAASIVSPAEPPDSPSSPKPVRNAAIGVVIGLLLACLAVILFERLDPRLRTAKEAEAALARPILGLVRRSRDLAYPVADSVPASGFDDFLALRSYLPYMSSNGDVRSVLVTSGAPGDGKTTIAWNLSTAAASPGARVLLVEGDLRKPTLASALEVTSSRGLADVLAGTAAIEDVVQEVAVKNVGAGTTPARVIEVVFAGTGSAADRGAWERFGALIESLEATYDLIVIDTPPLVTIPDAVPLLPHVDGVIVIGRLGNTPRAALLRLKEQLATLDAQAVGLVVNSVETGPEYGYGYPGSA